MGKHERKWKEKITVRATIVYQAKAGTIVKIRKTEPKLLKVGIILNGMIREDVQKIK